MQNEQCEEFGYYEVTSGYRKIPGNICSGGIDLSPARYQCTAKGWLASWFTFRGMFMLALIGALCYYGWPVIEAVLLLLPIPDPTEMKQQSVEYVKKTYEYFKNMGETQDQPVGYQQQQFAAPASMQDDSDENDEEDVGQDVGGNSNALDYDSDEKDNDQTDGAQQELISLDGGAEKRKKVPKLKKPGK